MVAVTTRSSAKDRPSCVDAQVCVCPVHDGVYPCPPTLSQRRRGSTYRRKMRGLSRSPWMVPRVTWMGSVWHPVDASMITRVVMLE